MTTRQFLASSAVALGLAAAASAASAHSVGSFACQTFSMSARSAPASSPPHG